MTGFLIMTEKRFKNSLNKWNLYNYFTNDEKVFLKKKSKPYIIYIFNRKIITNLERWKIYMTKFGMRAMALIFWKSIFFAT